MDALDYLIGAVMWLAGGIGVASDGASQGGRVAATKVPIAAGAASHAQTKKQRLAKAIKAAEALRDGNTEVALRHFLSTRTPGQKNEGMRLGLRMRNVLGHIRKNGWKFQAEDLVGLSEKIAPHIKGLDCQQPIFVELAKDQLRNQNKATAVRIIKTFRTLPNKAKPGSMCGYLDLRTLAIALELEQPNISNEDKYGFWVQGNVVVYSHPPILIGQQLRKFTETLVDHRLPHMDRAAAYKFIASDARHYKMLGYATYLEDKAKSAAR